MPQGNNLSARVSFVLRKADFPVLRYADRKDERGRSGIRVSTSARQGEVSVHFFLYMHETSAVRDRIYEQDLSRQARDVLLAAGLDVETTQGSPMLTVCNRENKSRVVCRLASRRS
jgi:hypothetical protein